MLTRLFKEKLVTRNEQVDETALIVQIFHVIDQRRHRRADQIGRNYSG